MIRAGLLSLCSTYGLWLLWQAVSFGLAVNAQSLFSWVR